MMRWRNGLMGLSDIAKVPVSHGVVNPAILRQVRAFAFAFSPWERSAARAAATARAV